ncbi:hypothetical protein EST38_g11442 [Candolleomyces aberdarensis]|uniref:Uncharacterized protein n=1 Tax=Candolleomyces aberdarensis TaxID=2316362 RepID=A0A4Q2D5I0_9AGAR|nr:hypothetical protein EST38_g11442 [Candolleomyces aberdarensis]
MQRSPTTLASQGGEDYPSGVQLIEAAFKESSLVSTDSESDLSLDTRLHRLVYDPFKAAIPLTTSLARPYLIAIKSLDECEDKDGVENFLQSAQRFFDENTYILLPILITSRVEQHIQPLLPVTGSGLWGQFL